LYSVSEIIKKKRIGGKSLAKMGKKRRLTYRNNLRAQRSCKLDTVTGQGKMVLVMEMSGNFDFSSLWEPYTHSLMWSA